MTEKQFIQLLKGNQKRYNKPCYVLQKALGVSLRTTTKYINNPSMMTVNDFCIVARELRLSQDEIMEFLGGMR